MTDTLVERLVNSSIDATLCRETVKSLQLRDAEIAKLREALEPFADAYDDDRTEAQQGWEIWEQPEAMNIKVSDLRRARTALGGGNE